MQTFRFTKVKVSRRYQRKVCITGENLKSAQTLNGHNSIIFKYYEKEKYRFESKFNLVFIFINLYSQSSRYYGHY